MKSQPLPPLHGQLFTCLKCHAQWLKEDFNQKTGKCKICSGNKMNAKRVLFEGHWFHSRYEANRYAQLLWLQQAHKIGPILLQPPYPITINGTLICTYYADFLYTNLETGEIITEDAKGFRSEGYKLKKKLVEAMYPIKITEV